jgi:deoxyribonuclease-4
MPKDEMPLLGAHMSIAHHPHKALLRGKEVGCQVIQIFTRNRSQWLAKGLTESEIVAFDRARRETLINPIAIHTSYLINLASSRSDVRKRSLHLLLYEMEWAERLGIPYLVMHPGSHTGDGERRGLGRITEAINRVHDKTKDYGVTILLETIAGQGTNLGYRFEHLAEIFAGAVYKERLGVCLDTCHVFAAGYDFRTAETYEQLFEEFDRIIGLRMLRLFHINDSKHGLGSKKDRHEHPGEGLIGSRGFSLLLNDPLFADLPFLLETPKGVDDDGGDRDFVNLNFLRTLIRGTEHT